MNEISIAKQVLRQKLSSPETACSQKVLSTVKNWQTFQEVESIGIYIAMNDEVNLNELLETDKKLYLPIYDKVNKVYRMALVQDSKDLVEGKFGISEPSEKCRLADVDDIGLWLIPGRAFDKKGNRLGRGKGFYDRLLADENGLKAGVPADGKVLENVPTDKWDVKMNFLLLEDEVMTCN
ncbi:MAG: 5-formyltetrahydrofolate cyclo-ligase [Lentisphaerales bacterium]|nr:5-formyltetrahydrofolate cyclo-ligase [Lentisphaerales bacterium]